jgi:hypothetical protein
MAATIVKSSTATSVSFGLTAEASMLVSSYNRSVSSDKAEIMDADGDIVSIAYYNEKASISISGAQNGFSDGAGAILTVANDFGGGGGADGTIVIDSVTETKTADGFTTIDISATQYEATLT